MKRQSKGKAVAKRLEGGPYAGLLVLQRSGGTLPIKVGSWHGRYNAQNVWEGTNHG
jgi:hypothetical protein